MTGGAGSGFVRRRATAKAISLLWGVIAALALAASFASTAGRSGIDGAQQAAATDGYILAALDGGVFTFGDTPFQGSLAGTPLAAPIADGSLTPTGLGYLLYGRDGGVFKFGDAPFFGSGSGMSTRPFVAGDITPTGAGYVLVDSVGRVFSFGDAPALGSISGSLSAPIVDVAITPGNDGYWLTGADGGVFTFGAAPFHGSLGSTKLNKPITAFISSIGAPGYALVAEDGGVFTRGGFPFNGSRAGAKLNRAIVDAAATPSGNGYFMTGADGGVFAFGDAVFRGSHAAKPLRAPIIAILAPENSPPVAVDDTVAAVEDTLLSVAAASGVLANDTDAEGDPLTASVVTTTTNGVLSLSPDGSFTYTPGVNFNGADSFTYRVTDGITSDTGVVTINVAAVNDVPVAVDDVATTGENANAVISVLANDTDVDGDTLAVSALDLTGTAGGAVHNGTTVTYTPPPAANALAVGESLNDTFTYTVIDPSGATDIGSVTVTVTGVNDAPDAVNDAAGAAEDGPAVVVAVRGNDTDPDTTDTLTVTAVNTAGTVGTVAITNAGADVTYNPNGAFEGLDTGETAQTTFTYTISDGNGGTDTATVTMTITGANDAPDAVNDSATTNEDAGSSSILVLVNDTDVDVETLTVTAVDTTGTTGAVGNAGTHVTYNPNGQFNSLAVGQTATDTFTYTVSDGTATDTATVTVTITGVNDAPNAVNDPASIAESAGATAISVLTNDTDPDTADTLTVTAVTQPTDGVAAFTAGGVTFNPNGEFEDLGVGETRQVTFTYSISDGNGGTDTATVTVTVTGVNDAPDAVNDAAGTGENGAPLTVDVLANDTDVDGDALTISAVGALSNGGEVTNNGDDVTFKPKGDFEDLDTGETRQTTFTYTANDGNGGTDTATVTITVTGANDAPVGVDDAAGAPENGPAVTVLVLSNDTDVDVETLTVTAVTTPSNGGSVTNNGTDVTYNPNGAFESLGVGDTAQDTFTYTVSDGTATDTALVTVTITGSNDPMDAVDDAAGANENGPGVIVNVLGNDTDIDGDALTITAVGTTSNGGTVTNNAGQDVTFNPNGAFEGLDTGETAQTTFTYTASDGNGSSDTATVTITVTGSNDAPVGVDDTAGAAENGPGVTVLVLSNDTDVDVETLTVTAVTTPSNGGTVTNNGTDVTYNPNGAFESLGVGDTAQDTFTYTVSDGTATDTALVTITITGSNDPMDAVNDAANAGEDGPGVTVNVLGNDTDIDGDPLTITAVSTTTNGGTVTNNAGQDVTFNPNNAFEGLDTGETAQTTFTYTASDGNGSTDTATVTITINGANDAPVGVDDADGTDEYTATVVDVLANDTDVDVETLTVTGVTTPTNGGTVTNNGTDVTYNPNGAFASLNTGQTGTDTFTYTVSDGTATDTVTVTMTIDGVTNLPPNAVDDASSTNEDAAPYAINVLANDSDGDGGTLSVSAIDTTGTVGGVTNNGTNVTYNPAAWGFLAAGATAQDTFTYTLSDGQGGTDTATVTVTVTGVNDAPVAVDDGVNVPEDSTGQIVAVLANDTDDVTDTFSVTAVNTAGTLGSVTNNGTNVTYDPNGLFEGLDAGETAQTTFTYTITDNHGSTDTATVTITIDGANDAPVAVDDSYGGGGTIDEDDSPTVLDVRANDTDVDVESLTVTAVDTTGTTGGVTITNAGANVTYNPAAFGYLAAGQTAQDTFTYTVSDGTTTDTALVTITVTGINDAPVGADDAANVPEDSSGTVINVLGNDVDGDATDTLSVSGVNTAGTLGSVTNNGTDVTYDPNGAFEGLDAGETAQTTFTYTVSDGNGGTDTQTVTITVDGANDGPDAVADTGNANEPGPAVTIDVLANDTDDDVEALTVTAVDTTATSGTVTITNSGADVLYNPNGQFEYLAAGQTGEDAFFYTVSDGTTTSSAKVTVTITGTNDAPTAVDDTDTTPEYADKVVDVLNDDTDPDTSDTLVVTVVADADVDSTDGTVTITNAGANVTYDPNGAFDSLEDGQQATDTFSYTISDGNGGTDTATVTMTITGSDIIPPVAADDTAGANEDGPAVTIDVLANDTDDVGPITVSAVDTTGTDGTVTITNAGADVLYNPNGAFEDLGAGETELDTFTYTADDGAGGTDTATVTVTVTGTNDAPVADADGATVNEDAGATTVDVRNGDTDAESDTLTVTAIDTTGTDGIVLITNAGADVSYNPNGQFNALSVGQNGTDSFTYTVSDGNGGTDTETVTITINGANDTPVGVDDGANVPEDSTGTVVNVLGNDTDADSGDSLAVSLVDTTGTTGLVTNNGTNVTYNPNGAFAALGAGETAQDTFTYTVSDGNGGTDTATVTITIDGANDGPVAVDDTATVTEDSTNTNVLVLANDTDADGDTLSVTVVGTPNNGGSATNNGTDVTFNPGSAFQDLDTGESRDTTFTYTVSDGNGGTDVGSVTVTVTGANDAPVAVDDATNRGEDTGGVALNVLGNDTDVDVETLTVTAVDTTGTTGLVTNNGTTVTYNPNGQFNSLAVGETATDTFTYTVSDGTATDTATVTITIDGANDQPDAVNDPASISEDGPAAAINVRANDTDPDTSDVLTVTAVNTAGTTGLVTITNSGQDVTYNPNGQFEALNVGQTAQTTFTYTISDGNGGTDTATVTVTINGVNDAPVAVDDSFTTGTTAIGNVKFAVGVTVTGEPVVNASGNLRTNDTDVDNTNASLVYSFESAPAGAQVTVNSNGTFTYVSPPGQEGNLTFEYRVTDPQGGFDVGLVTIKVDDVVWFVKAGAPGGGNGTSTLPYNAIAPLSAGGELDDPNDYVFLYAGTYTGGLPLEASQKLYGEPNGITVQGTLLVAAGGANPVVQNAAGAGITLADAVEIQRVNVSSTSGDGVTGGAAVNTATYGTNTTITSTTGAAFKLNGGNGAVSMGATITNSAGRSVDIQNRTGGTVTISQLVTGNSGSAGIFLNNNTGTSRTDFAGMVLTTTTNPGLTATSAGTISVGGANNTITTTTGIAINIANTTIASAGVLFDKVSSNGASSGIILENTGSVGGLSVTGDGTLAAGSGGTIQNASGDGIRLGFTRNTVLQWMNLTNTSTGAEGATCHMTSADDCVSGIDMDNATNITLHRINVDTTGGQGISAHTTNGLTITNSVVDNAGNSDNNNGMLFTQLSGTVLVQDVSMSSFEEVGTRLYNSSGTLNMTMRRMTMSDNSGVLNLGEDGFQIEIEGGTSTILVDDSDFNNLRRSGVDAIAENASTMNLTIQSSSVLSSDGIAIDNAFNHTANVKLNYANNTITDTHLTGINMAAAINTTVHVTITGNTITDPSPHAAGNGQGGFGIRISQEEDGDLTARVQNNTLSGHAFTGIVMLSRLGDLNTSAGTSVGDIGTMHASVKGNNVGAPVNTSNGIQIEAQNTENTACVVYGSTVVADKNTATGTVGSGIRARQDNGALFQVEELATGLQTTATMNTHLAARNTSTPAASSAADTGFTGVATGTCRTATLPPTP